MILKRAFRNRSIPELFHWGLERSYGIPTGKLRLLPDFIIIGTQRGGTTSLFNYLSQHPSVYPAFPKEVHYFSNNYQKGINWYRSHFPLIWQKRRVERNGKSGFLTGEATPYYLSHPCVPYRVSKTLPNVLLIILLRNPVERGYSHYHHEVRMGIETLTFKEAIEVENERLSCEVEKLQEEDRYRSFNFQHFSYLSRGIYLEQIKMWRKYFARSQMLILRSESFFNDPSRVLKQVIDFIGLSDWEFKEFKKYNSTQYQDMDPTLRARLSKYFELHNQALYDYLCMDLGWSN